MPATLRNGNGLSPTRGIYRILKPYWRNKTLDDQHWAYIVECLKKIETRCKECKALAELDQGVKCMECLERKLIEAL